MKHFSKYLFSLIYLFTIALCARTQTDSSFHFLKTIKGDITDFAADNLDNLYLLSSTDQLKKISINGDSVAVFNNVRKFGKVSYIDVSNPLRVLLYYKDFSTIVVLDRLLNVRNTIDLRKQNIFQARAIGLSYDNKIWLYDELENKLKKIDEDGKLLFETNDFRQLFDNAPVPYRIFDQEGFVYLYDKSGGVFVFDYYGALKNKILITGWDNFKVSGKSIFGSTNDTLFRYRIDLYRVYDYKIPSSISGFQKMDFTSSRFYTMKKNEIEVYLLR